MELYILRHGIAVDRGAPGCRNDDLRPLTPEGRRKLRLIAMAFKAMGLTFDLVLSSPVLRAKQTAEIVVHELGADKLLQFSHHLSYGGNPKDLIEEISKAWPGRERVLLVGHEPYLSGLVSRLLTGRDDLPLTLKKGGFCHLSIEHLRYGACGILMSLLTPAQMTKM
jgi:phosphohistidine phosphatase